MPYEFAVVVHLDKVLDLAQKLLVIVPEIERGRVQIPQSAVFQSVVVGHRRAHGYLGFLQGRKQNAAELPVRLVHPEHVLKGGSLLVAPLGHGERREIIRQTEVVDVFQRFLGVLLVLNYAAALPELLYLLPYGCRNFLVHSYLVSPSRTLHAHACFSSS